MTVQEFVRQHAGEARLAAVSTGVPVEAILAQWGLETGWGTSRVYREAHNLAGITGEGGYRQYPSTRDFVRDYIALLSSSRYAPVRATKDPLQVGFALQAAGWAEDPAYGYKMASIVPQVAEALARVPETAPAAAPAVEEPGGTLAGPSWWERVTGAVRSALSPEAWGQRLALGAAVILIAVFIVVLALNVFGRAPAGGGE